MNQKNLIWNARTALILTHPAFSHSYGDQPVEYSLTDWFCYDFLSPENIWDKVFKIGPNKICERQPLNDFEGIKTYPISLEIFKSCHPQILLGPLLNTLYHISLSIHYFNWMGFRIRTSSTRTTNVCFLCSKRNKWTHET